MPARAHIDQAYAGLAHTPLVVGCRGTNAENRQPGAAHTQHRYASGRAADFANQNVIFFIHGYNTPPDEALASSARFFRALQAAIVRDGGAAETCTYALFTWPGDTGTVYFNDAQEYAQFSGVALFNLLLEIETQNPRSVSIVAHSLGAHVPLRALAVLGQRIWMQRSKLRVESLLLLGAAVEDDVFERPGRTEEYHFPESAFGMRKLHIVASRDDEVLAGPFLISEQDRALGYSGPPSMSPLVSLRERVRELLAQNEDFAFELHDFSQRSPTIFNSDLWVKNHGDYWARPSQLDYYVNFIPHT
jgi:esterase/lipase superfamily enzyme